MWWSQGFHPYHNVQEMWWINYLGRAGTVHPENQVKVPLPIHKYNMSVCRHIYIYIHRKIVNTNTIYGCLTKTSTIFNCLTKTSTIFHCLTKTSTIFHCLTKTSTIFHCLTKTSTIFHCLTKTSTIFDFLTRYNSFFTCKKHPYTSDIFIKLSYS